MSSLEITTRILADADQCVLCGLCLPHCPSYGLGRHEAESPRGRIALMQAVAAGRLEADSSLRGHLDRCLGCRACEAMCPSQVPYGRLLRTTREYLHEQGRTDRIAEALSRPARRKLLAAGLQLFRISGLQALQRRWSLFGKLDRGRLLAGLPTGKRGPRLPAYAPAPGTLRGTVGLFVGCTGDLLQRALLHDVRRLLAALGYAVHIPPGQGCCGALHVQQGDGTRARELAEINLAAFPEQLDAIVSVASGCGALLQEYAELLPDSQVAVNFASRVVDINVFLASLDWSDGPGFRPLAKTVAVHEPCSLRNVLKGSRAVYELLEKIPGLNVLALTGNEHCCGAAGSYFLHHAGAARSLREPKIHATMALQADYLLSANIGCAMHLAAGLHEAGQKVEVLHPVRLLARQLTI